MGGKALGYNIKHITRPGYSTKKPYYEVSPGVWVPRGEVPEVLEYRKRTRHLKNEQQNKIYETQNTDICALCLVHLENMLDTESLSFEFTWEEWWQHWLNQKKKWGLVCPYTRVKMTMIKGLKKKRQEQMCQLIVLM